MLAGLPCIVRKGFNYGHCYPHINPQTGRFVTECELPEVIVQMLDRYEEYSPREWVLANMSCHKATEVLGNEIKRLAASMGESWTRNLAANVSELDGTRYWDSADKERFADDYEFLRSAIRNSAPSSGVNGIGRRDRALQPMTTNGLGVGIVTH